MYGGFSSKFHSLGSGYFWYFACSLIDSSSTVSNPDIIVKNKCNSGWLDGSIVTSNNGLNLFNIII